MQWEQCDKDYLRRLGMSKKEIRQWEMLEEEENKYGTKAGFVNPEEMHTKLSDGWYEVSSIEELRNKTFGSWKEWSVIAFIVVFSIVFI